MTLRNRVRELRRVPARLLRPHPRNWRTHPPAQRRVLQNLFDQIGCAAALVARELPDGSLELIDGHLRAATAPDDVLPVLVVDLDPAEAELLLAALDPLSALAGADPCLLSELLSDLRADQPDLQQMLADLARRHGAAPPLSPPRPEPLIAPSYQVVVACASEDQQRAVYEQLTGQGLSCRLLLL
jgi:hypothetical protein